MVKEKRNRQQWRIEEMTIGYYIQCDYSKANVYMCVLTSIVYLMKAAA